MAPSPAPAGGADRPRSPADVTPPACNQASGFDGRAVALRPGAGRPRLRPLGVPSGAAEGPKVEAGPGQSSLNARPATTVGSRAASTRPSGLMASPSK